MKPSLDSIHKGENVADSLENDKTSPKCYLLRKTYIYLFCSFEGAGLGHQPNDGQSLVKSLCSGITPDEPRELYGVQGVILRLAMCKENIPSTVL